MSKVFTIDELKQYNGIHKKSAYVGYKGKVYDVTKVFAGGKHAGIEAGLDITDSFSQGPHQEDIFNNFPVVGTIRYNTGLVKKLFNVSNGYTDILLRLALGIVFIAHGGQKLFGWFGGYGWEGTMGFLTQGLHVPALFAGLAILAEFFCGIAIIIGFLTKPAGLVLTVTMIVAALKVHLPNGFFLDSKGALDGVEYAYVLIMLSLYFAVKGAGIISVDKLISERIAGK